MLTLRFAGLGFIASTSFLLGAPTMPTKCDGGGGGAGGAPPKPVCGDGKTDPGETCDGSDLGVFTGFGQYEFTCETLGLVSGTLKCTSDCSYLDTTRCLPPVCGNGKSEPGEECDGTSLSKTACSAHSPAYIAGTLTCDRNCKYDISACVRPVCGDGVLEGEEVCDPVLGFPKTCKELFPGAIGGQLRCRSDDCRFDFSDCQFPSLCGNGKFDQASGEECDASAPGIDPLLSISDGICRMVGFQAGGRVTCNDKCRFDFSGCTQWAGCGNGIVDGNEKCEGADLGGVTCATLGDFTGAYWGYRGGTLKCSRCGYDVSECTK
jgi:hypothetical protein